MTRLLTFLWRPSNMTNTTHIYNLDELQDRRIMMDKKLPPYGYALIILTGFLMVYLLLWSTKNVRTVGLIAPPSGRSSWRRRAAHTALRSAGPARRRPCPRAAEETAAENPSFKFSHVECLLYALHTLAKQSPEFFTFPDDAQRLKDFRSRLQYLARGTQG